MFMTALNVALGLEIAGGLLVEIDPASTYTLHTAGFLLGAPAAFAGTAFFVGIAAITGNPAPSRGGRGGWPWLGSSRPAVFGSLSLTGPLNSGNGIVGGIAAKLGLYLIWIFAVSVWWLRGEHTTQSSLIRPALLPRPGRTNGDSMIPSSRARTGWRS